VPAQGETGTVLMSGTQSPGNRLLGMGPQKGRKMELLQKSSFLRSSGGFVLFEMLALLLLLLLLVLADLLCYQQALLVVLDEQRPVMLPCLWVVKLYP